MKALYGTAVVVALLGTVTPAGAVGILYAHDTLANLYTVDVASGAATRVGNTGTVLTDIAFDRDGNLYGIDFGSLYRIDPLTAETTVVGPVGYEAYALVFDENGELWGAGSSLMKINTASGQGTVVAGLNGYYAAGDLAFDSQWRLYLTTSAGHLLELDRTSGAITDRGAIPDVDVYGFVRVDDGTLYGITSGNILMTIDPASGQGTYLRSITGDFLASTWGSAFTTEALPEPASLVLIALGGWMCVHRRRIQR